MAVRVVLDVPKAGGSGALLRGLAALIGSVLMIAGVLVGPLAAIAVWGLIEDRNEPGGSTSGIVRAVAFVVGAVFAFRLGLWLARGRRRLALYLRKFGHGDSTRAVTTALTSAVGRRVRVVTLDDAMVAAVGVDRTRRRLAALGFLVFAGLVAWGVIWFRDFAQSSGDSDATSAGDIFAALVQAFLVLIGLVLATSLALFLGGVYLAAVRAGRFMQRTIDTEAAIAPTAARIAKLSRKVFSPRLFVTRVSGSIWPQAVRSLAGAADVVIIDVSHPTDPLLWEVETMKLMFGNRWVLVGAFEQVAALANPQTAAGSDRRAVLARSLDGEEIIAYGHTPADHARFIRALRSRLHGAVSGRAATPAPPRPVAA